MTMRRRDFLAGGSGVIATWPRPAASQAHKRNPKIAVLWHAASAEEEHPYYGELLRGFRELGYGEGSLTFEHRFPDEKPALFTSMAAELVSLNPSRAWPCSSIRPSRFRNFMSTSRRLLDPC
jgi:putative ABC transport system substrate-binding protein